MTRDQFIAKAMEFRRHADEAHARFMLFLIEGELRHPDVWQQDGSFASFLNNNGIADAGVFAKFKAAREQLGDNIAERIGTFGAIEAVRVVDPTRRAEVVRSLEAWTTERGAPPTQRLAHAHVVALDPKVRTPRPLKAQNRIDALERENAALRQQVKQLTAERDKLAASVEKLRGKKKAA